MAMALIEKHKMLMTRRYQNILSLKKLIFPPIEDSKTHCLLIDDESIKYITFHSSAQEITNIIMNNLTDFPCPSVSNANFHKWNGLTLNKKMKQLVITEMTAGVGGNVINFAKYFKYVNAIEIDSLRCTYLEKNISLYGYINVNCYNQDSVHLLLEREDISQDIVFFDPPWGGRDYKLYTKLRLTFGKYTIETVSHMLLQQIQTKMIVLKLPNNYDFDYLTKELKNYRINKFVLDRMTIVIVKNYPTQI